MDSSAPGGDKVWKGGGRVHHHGRGGEVTSDLLSRESKQQMTWNFSPFVLWIPKKTGGNLNENPLALVLSTCDVLRRFVKATAATSRITAFIQLLCGCSICLQ